MKKKQNKAANQKEKVVEKKAENITQEEKATKVEVQCELLACRCGPSFSETMVTTLRKGEVYEIAEKNKTCDWGRIDNLGWIKLEFTKEV